MAMGTLVSFIERAADLLAPIDALHWKQLLASAWMATDGTGLKDLHRGVALPEEDEERAAPWLTPESLHNQPCQPVEAPPQVDGLEPHEDLHASRNHRCSPSSTSRTAASVSGAKFPDTSTRNSPTLTTTGVSRAGASGTTSTRAHCTWSAARCLVDAAIRRPHAGARAVLKHRSVHRLLTSDAEHRLNVLHESGRVLEAGCYAHGVREFDDAEATQPVLAAEGGATGDLLLHGELVVQFARVLGVSADEILGIEPKRSKPACPAVDKTLARRLAQLQTLPRRDRDALLRTFDAFLAKSSHAA